MLESFLRILNGERSDEIVWTADLTYWIDGQKQAGTGQPDLNTEHGYLELCRSLGCMPFYWYDQATLGSPVYDGVEFVEESHGRRRVQSWQTPVGEVRQESTYLPLTVSEAITKYAVENEDDLKVLLYILEHRRFELLNLDAYDRRAELWAEYDGLPLLMMPRSPVPALFVEWAGVQNAVFLMMDYPELAGRALDLMESQERPILDAVCDHAPSLVHFPDNLTSETFTGIFDEHMMDRYARRLSGLHEAGARVAVHLDGTVRGLLPKLAAVGFDAVEAITPAPVGDVDVESMRQVAAEESLVLWGGVPGAMFAPPYGWPQMRAHVEGLIAAWSGTPFVIGVGDQVPPNGDISMCRKIADMVKALSV